MEKLYAKRDLTSYKDQAKYMLTPIKKHETLIFAFQSHLLLWPQTMTTLSNMF